MSASIRQVTKAEVVATKGSVVDPAKLDYAVHLRDTGAHDGRDRRQDRYHLIHPLSPPPSRPPEIVPTPAVRSLER